MIRHAMTSRPSAKATPSATSNAVRPQALTARWLLRMVDMDLTEPDIDFFECASWACGGLAELIKRLDKEFSSSKERKNSSIRKAVRELSKVPRKEIPAALDEAIENYNEITPIVMEIMIDILNEASPKQHTNSAEAMLLQRFFGLDDNSTRLCEYAFMANNYEIISNYFEDCCEIDASSNRDELANMLDIDNHRCREIMLNLTEMGILDENYEIRLTESVEKALIEGRETNLEKAFCMPLQGETLPLEQFTIQNETCEDIISLLQSDNDEPLQILLYGKPGVGKSTFVSSLAHELGLKAWSVPCRSNYSTQDRQAALMTCLRIASKHKGAFVLVDEAEKILCTEDEYGNGDFSERLCVNKLLTCPVLLQQRD